MIYNLYKIHVTNTGSRDCYNCSHIFCAYISAQPLGLIWILIKYKLYKKIANYIFHITFRVKNWYARHWRDRNWTRDARYVIFCDNKNTTTCALRHWFCQLTQYTINVSTLTYSSMFVYNKGKKYQHPPFLLYELF